MLLYLVNGSYVMQLLTDPRGMILTGMGLCSLGIGVFIMIRMAKFPI
jgi:Flp pilus assembly protein TadB